LALAAARAASNVSMLVRLPPKKPSPRRALPLLAPPRAWPLLLLLLLLGSPEKDPLSASSWPPPPPRPSSSSDEPAWPWR
jgi:hypothetical protein